MVYYFADKKYTDLLEENVNTAILKIESENELAEVKNDIEKIVQKITNTSNELEIRWTSRVSLGNVFTDFPKENGKFTIGAGQKELFKKIKDEYAYLVLTKFMPFNRREEHMGTKKFLIINLDNFQKIRDVMKNNFASIFLYKHDDEKIENLINKWMLESPEMFRTLQGTYVITDQNVANFLEQHKTETLEDLSDLIRNSTSVLNRKIAEKQKLFAERLEKFRRLVDEVNLTENEKSNLENELKNFIHDNPWVIDFTYNDKNINKKTHGDVDVLLVESYLGFKKGLIIELKRPDVDPEKKYRNREAVRAAITDAITQLIHYTEDIMENEINQINKNDSALFVEGLIIIGNDMKEFIQIFNKYLHNVKIKSYKEIYLDAKRRLDTFTDGPKL